MAKVAPFCSIRENCYHDNSRCCHGSEIPFGSRINGTKNKPLCKECAKLDTVDAESKSVSG